MKTRLQLTRSRIEEHIRAGLQNGEKALITFVTAGYPSVDFTVEVIKRMFDAGSDVVELGVPFSDPLADGPVIQNANTQAILRGMKTRDVFEAVSRVRSDGYSNPLVLLVYINTLYRYGIDRFLEDCLRVGIDGLVVPDLPVEERHLIQDPLERITSAAKRPGAISLIPMVSPTCDDRRVEAILKGGSGFVYCVSTTGVTGVRAELPAEVTDLVGRVRARTDIPVAVGFGVGDPLTAAKAGALADAVIVGSVIVSTISDKVCKGGNGGEREALEAVGALVSSLKAQLVARPDVAHSK